MSQHQQNEGEHSSLLNIQYSEHQDEQNETFNDPPPMYTSQEDGLPSYQASYNEYIYKNAQEQGQGQGQLQQQQGSTSYQSFNQPVYTATTVVYHPPRVERNFDHIPSNFCGACLACWFCCLPFGCIAVIYSSQVSVLFIYLFICLFISYLFFFFFLTTFIFRELKLRKGLGSMPKNQRCGRNVQLQLELS